MRIFKKVLFFVLALLPLISIIFGLFSLKGTGTIPTFQGVTLIEDESYGMTFDFVDGSVEELLFGHSSIVIGNVDVGFMSVFFGFVTVMISIGVPINLSLMFWIMFYIGYLMIIELIFVLFDLIMFIPRKCKEVFE